MKEINVVGAIMIKNNEVFCCQRPLDKTLGGLWEFPGGKIEKNETEEKALYREIVEELECEIQNLNFFERTSYVYDFGKVNLSTFTCEIVTGEPVLTEHLDAKWLPYHKLDTVDWAPADIPIVKKLMTIDDVRNGYDK